MQFCNIKSWLLPTIFVMALAVVRADMESAPTEEFFKPFTDSVLFSKNCNKKGMQFCNSKFGCCTQVAIQCQFPKNCTKKGMQFCNIKSWLLPTTLLSNANFIQNWQQKRDAILHPYLPNGCCLIFVNYASTGVSTGSSLGCSSA